MTALIRTGLFSLCACVLQGGPIILSNLDGADPSFQTTGGSIFGDLVGTAAIANGFVPDGTYLLGSIEVAISRLADENTLFLRLVADNGFQPGTILETFDLSGTLGLFGDTTSPLIALSVLHPQLQEGALYWVIAEFGSNSVGVWHYTNALDLGPRATQLSPGSWSASVEARDAFRVTATDVPEPATFLSSVAGLLMITALARFLRLGSTPS